MKNKFYIFGAGKNGRDLLLRLTAAGIAVTAFIDNDKAKQNAGVGKLECIGVEEAVKRGAQNNIVVISPADDRQIREQLEKEEFKNIFSMKRWMRKEAFFEPALFEETDYNHAVPFNHYESPYPDIREIHQKEKKLFDAEKEVLDIDFNTGRQLELLNQMKRIEMPGWPAEKSAGGSYRYYYNNLWFSKGCADALYYMMRILKPQNIIEVGSGYSTAAMLDINEKFMGHRVSIRSIEPNAERLKSLVREADDIEILEKNLQEVPVTFFEKLRENDILFIDSSHVSKFNSDVNYILFEILPRLRSGIYIHFHDIFYPFIYPKKWVYEGRAYNEAYMLRAFLMNSKKYSIQLFGSMLMHTNKERIPDHLQECGEGSLWIKKG